MAALSALALVRSKEDVGLGREHIFVSYSKSDRDFVRRLSRDLKSAGAYLWIDELSIGGGELWVETIEWALESCSSMLIVLSPEAIASQNVNDEISFALDEGKRVVPLLLRKCRIPFRLRRYHHINFSKDYDLGLKSLVKSLSLGQSTATAAGGSHWIQAAPDHEAVVIEEFRLKLESRAKERAESRTEQRAGSEIYDDAQKRWIRKCEEESFRMAVHQAWEQSLALHRQRAYLERLRKDREVYARRGFVLLMFFGAVLSLLNSIHFYLVVAGLALGYLVVSRQSEG